METSSPSWTPRGGTGRRRGRGRGGGWGASSPKRVDDARASYSDHHHPGGGIDGRREVISNATMVAMLGDCISRGHPRDFPRGWKTSVSSMEAAAAAAGGVGRVCDGAGIVRCRVASGGGRRKRRAEFSKTG